MSGTEDETSSHLDIIAESISSLAYLIPKNVAPPTNNHNESITRGTEIFSCEGVQLYFIGRSEDNVTTKSDPSVLKIIQLPPESTPPAFIEVSKWVYPLIPNKSPVFKSEEGNFVFPNLMPGASPGSAVGLVLSQNVSLEQKNNLESLLLSLCGLTNFTSVSDSEFNHVPNVIMTRSPGEAQANTNILSPCGTQDLSSKTTQELVKNVTAGFAAAAEVASRGLSLGATTTAQFIDKGTAFIKDQISPATVPTQIPSDVFATIEVVKGYTAKAVELSSIVVKHVAETTINLAKFAACYLQLSATSAIAQMSGQSQEDTAQCIDNVLSVTGGALKGIGLVFSALNQASKILSNSLANNTVKVVEHCYGPQAARMTEEAASTIGNITTLGLQNEAVDPNRALARLTKSTGKEVFVKCCGPP